MIIFDRIQKFCSSGGAIASKKARAYRIHPFFAGLSLISSALLTFGSPSKISTILPYKTLVAANLFICAISSVSARPLTKIMIGSRDAKKVDFSSRQCICTIRGSCFLTRSVRKGDGSLELGHFICWWSH